MSFLELDVVGQKSLTVVKGLRRRLACLRIQVVDALDYCCGKSHSQLPLSAPPFFHTPPTDLNPQCPNFFHLSIRSPFCHDKDATGNILHELTHCANVLSPRTHDYAYGWDNSVSLPTRQRIVNADSYELYAHDLGAKCFKGINHWNIPNPWFY